MNLNKLLLNPSKTEFLLIGTKQQRQTYLSAMISSQSVSLLAILASSLTLTYPSLIKSTLYSKSCHFHIRDIRRICYLLPLSTATALANSLVSSKLDYCNSLYSGISQTSVLNLESLEYRRLKTDLVMYYKIIHNLIDLNCKDFLKFSRHSFTRSHNLTLTKPICKTNLYLNSFSNRLINVWNRLPSEVVNAPSLSSFVNSIKKIDFSPFLIF